jgi:hypothetical protein
MLVLAVSGLFVKVLLILALESNVVTSVLLGSLIGFASISSFYSYLFSENFELVVKSRAQGGTRLLGAFRTKSPQLFRS